MSIALRIFLVVVTLLMPGTFVQVAAGMAAAGAAQESNTAPDRNDCSCQDCSHVPCAPMLGCGGPCVAPVPSLAAESASSAFTTQAHHAASHQIAYGRSLPPDHPPPRI